MDSSLSFGFFPRRLELDEGTFAITSLETFDRAVANVSKSPHLKDGWVWPPTHGKRGFDPRPVFRLPLTHELTVRNMSPADADPLAEYLITALGFLQGMVLIPDGWVHLTRVNVVPDRLRDYVLEDSARRRILNTALTFWQQHPEYRKNLFGLMYWHCAASAFRSDHEQFAWHYTVLDACWHLHASLNVLTRSGKVSHAERIKALAIAYDLKMPGAWHDGKAITEIRNELIHEARWGGQPIGFGPGPRIGYGENPHDGSPLHTIPLIGTLMWFTTRVILAILGETSCYVHSHIRVESYRMA